MSSDFVINAEPREDMGKGASRRLRREGQVPAIVYGQNQDPVMVSVEHRKLDQNLEYEAFFSQVLTLKVNGKGDEKVVLKDLQRHPSKPFILHMDLLRVSEKETLRKQIPLHFINEEDCPGVKAGGIPTHNITEVEVSCLPQDLPEYIEVDLATIDVNDQVHLSDLKVPAGVEIVELTHGEDHDLPVVAIHMPRGATTGEAAEGEEEEGGEEATE
ncbi:MAG TPA: 50S ribosomal protein L25/general stress protein Ctc [Gammaproteobacteria bacterium]|nr:50S ribosomal protein L25/general stress protein Ctc [Gammaproteobacteria bacterium]